MNELKENFKNWLIDVKHFEVRTPSGRPGTVYGYINRLDTICRLLYGSKEKWDLLAIDIDSVLGFYYLCRKGEAVITDKQLPLVKDFLWKFLGDFASNNSFFSVQLNGEGMDTPLTLHNWIRDLLPNLDHAWLKLKIDVKKNMLRKDRNMLAKFYDFLCETEPSIQQNGNSKEGKGNYFKGLSNNIETARSFKADTYFLGMDWGSATEPPKLIPTRGETSANHAWVEDILRISRKNLCKLADNGKIKRQKDGNFLLKDVNEYISNNFHPAKQAGKTAPTGKNIKEWWTAKEAKKNTGLSMKKIQRLRREEKIGYVQTSPQVYIYYPNDIKLYKRRKTMKIK